MIHEPGFSFGEGGIRQGAAAAVHRVMTAILLRRANHVWISIPGWEKRIRPYAFGRDIPFTWLPVPSNIPVVPYGGTMIHPIGYFGQYDESSIKVLSEILDSLKLPLLLIGRGAERVSHPCAIMAGELSAAALSQALQSCSVLAHCYPDGVSSRRSTIMASLAHGKPVVTNEGRWTEQIWRKSGCVALASDAAGFVLQLQRLLGSENEKSTLGQRALCTYNEHFALSNTIQKLIRAAR